MPKAIVFYIEGEEVPWTAISRPSGPFSVRIGRGAESDLTLPLQDDMSALGTVSRVHARLYSTSDEVMLEDLGSQNFTSIDDQIIMSATPVTFPVTFRLGSFGIEVREESLKQNQIKALRKTAAKEDSDRTNTVDALSAQGQAWVQLRESGRWIHTLVEITNLVTRCHRAEDFVISLQEEFANCFGAESVSVDLNVAGTSFLPPLSGVGFEDAELKEIEHELKQRGRSMPTHRVSSTRGDVIVWVVRPIGERRDEVAAVTVKFDGNVPAHVNTPAANAFVTQAIWIAQVLVHLLEELEAGRAVSPPAEDRGPSSKAFLACEETGLWGESALFKRCIHEAEVAATRYVNLVEQPGKVSTVFIQGESGTGKSALTRFAHRMSKRKDGPFVDLNCSAIPVALAESELFGYERGAHDKAFQSKPGQFEAASGGSLFLDEIGKTSTDFQSKLLKVLDTGEYTRIGGTRPLKVDCNVYVAESEDAQALCDRGQMLPELWYRIRAFTIKVPPLRDRAEDIEIIAAKIVSRLNSTAETATIKSLSSELIRAFTAYSWPGNIRELTQSIEVAFALCPPGIHEISIGHLPDSFKSIFGIDEAHATGNSATVDTSRALDDVLGDLERKYMVKLMHDCDGNVSEVTRRSGKSYNTVQSKLKELRKWIADASANGDNGTLDTLEKLAGAQWNTIRE